MLDQAQLQKDALISYVLLPSQRPTHPAKQWPGKICKVFTDHSGGIYAFQIESLEVGYEGLTELVLIQQIRMGRTC